MIELHGLFRVHMNEATGLQYRDTRSRYFDSHYLKTRV